MGMFCDDRLTLCIVYITVQMFGVRFFPFQEINTFIQHVRIKLKFLNVTKYYYLNNYFLFIRES